MTLPSPQAQAHTLVQEHALSGRVLQEAASIKALGLNPDNYVGVVDNVPLGFAGKLNLNDRIYIPEEYREQFRLADERAKKGFLDGERDHPDWHPTFDVAVRFVRMWTEDQDDGVVAGFGTIAFLNTTLGRDLFLLFQEGLEIGTSSRGFGNIEMHTLDGDSPYLKANEAFEGREVALVRNWRLDSHDLVRVPSAGTFLPTQESTQAAFERLSEAGFFKGSEPEGSEPEGSEPETQTEEVTMDEEQIKALIATAVAEAVGQIEMPEPPKGLTEAQAEMLAKMEEAQAGPPVEEQLSEAEQKIQALEAQLAARDLSVALGKAVAEHSTEVTRDLLSEMVKDGLVASVEDVEAWAGKLSAFAEGVKEQAVAEAAVPAGATTEAPDDDDTEAGNEPANENHNGTPSIFGDDFMAGLHQVAG